MKTEEAYMRGEAARASVARSRVFDWNKAATIIKERGAKKASAGLGGDWEWTGGDILVDGKPYLDDYTYLASVWAEPELDIDGDIISCWKYMEETGWDESTKWPQSAIDILNG